MALRAVWYVVVVLLWTAMTAGIYTVVTDRIDARRSTAHAATRCIERTQTTARLLEYALLHSGYRDIEDLRDLQPRVDAVPLFGAGESDVVYAYVLDMHGVIVLHATDPSQEGSRQEMPSRSTVLQPHANLLRFPIGNSIRAVVDVTVPLRLGTTVSGVLRMGYVQAPRSPWRPRAHAPALAGVGAVIVAGAGAAVLLGWSLRHQTRRHAGVVAAQRSAVEHEVGVIGAGIVHEVKNALNGIRMNADLVLERLPTLPLDVRMSLHKKIERIQREAERTGTLLSDFLTYAKPPAFAPSFVNVKALLADCVQFLEPERATRNAVMTFVCDDALRGVLADAQQLRQAVTNLLWNALQAVGPRGQITLRGTRVQGVISISVADTGGGMAPDVAARAFDAFFSTKPSGAGLGLAIVQRVARAHGGTVTLENKPGQGCTFTITIPVQAAAATTS